MTDKIGVLGETTATAVGTATVYQVPSGKAAKGTFMYKGALANTGTIELKINGVTVMKPSAAAGAEIIFSSKSALYENTGSTEPDGAGDATTVAPAPQNFYLSAGDLVEMVVGVVSLTSMNCQFVGTEVDAT